MGKNKNKLVIVSGGSRGLGQSIVDLMLSHDFCVATFSRSKSAFIKKIMEDKHYQKRFYWQQIDATDYHVLKKFTVSVYKRFGAIDVLINNAGVNLDRVLAVTNEQEIEDVLSLNLESVIKLSRYVSRIMLTNNGGSIINVSSVLGIRGFKGTSVYAATKAAIDGFSRSLARELGSRKIRVNAIAPGFLDTDMTKDMPEKQKNQILRRTPLGRLGKVEDVAGLIRYLISNEASFITGQTFVVDGGLTC